MESLIFDVDGTLWDAVALVAEGWNDGLQSMGFAPHCTEQSIRPLFGKTMTEIAQVVVPGVPQEQPSQIMNRGDWDRMKRMIGSGAGSTGTGTAGSGTGKTYAPGIYQVQTAALNIRQAPDADSRMEKSVSSPSAMVKKLQKWCNQK